MFAKPWFHYVVKGIKRTKGTEKDGRFTNKEEATAT